MERYGMTGCRQNVPRHAGLAWRGKTAVSMTRQRQLDSSYSLSISLSIMMASSQIYLVRHAESAHNISKDFSRPDPPLTPLGLEQAAKLEQTFPHSAHIGLVITSPLKRAIQTALSGFSHILDKRYYDSSSKLGVEGGAELIIDPGLQERSALPCDTGSDQDVLSEIFPRVESLTAADARHASKSTDRAGKKARTTKTDSLRHLPPARTHN
jgi:broad specificity phosphatase PhoE